MIATDEDALICDLAETYHIYDYRSLPCSKVAAFSVGLRDNSRIKMKMGGMTQSIDTLLLAMIADRLSILAWYKTKDGRLGINRPISITEKLLNTEKSKDIESFDTPDDFEKEREKLLKKERG